MKEIQLTQGQVALVDDWWYEELNQYKWCAHWNYNCYCAIRKNLGKIVYMHRVVAGTRKGEQTDHINHNTLDNREENLRRCTAAENQWNKRKQKNIISGYKGVTQNGNNWKARITKHRKKYELGTYPTPEEAARTYDKNAIELFGEFAETNF